MRQVNPGSAQAGMPRAPGRRQTAPRGGPRLSLSAGWPHPGRPREAEACQPGSLVAYASTAWLLRFVAQRSSHALVNDRIVVGALVFGLLGAGVLKA